MKLDAGLFGEVLGLGRFLQQGEYLMLLLCLSGLSPETR